jgi:hypothetical protein
MPVLGPWMGPVVNPKDGCGFAWELTCILAPVVLIAAAPFLLRLQVRPRTATVWWCGFLTALLAWLAAGILSALSGMG